MPTSPSPQLLVTAPQLAQLLVSTRRRLKLTQTYVGHRVGLSQNRISYLEKNPEELSLKQLLSWCAALGLELRLGERVMLEPDSAAEW